MISIEKQIKYLLYHQVNSDEGILPSTQKKIIEPTKFICSSLGKAFDKQINTIEDPGKKQVHALNTLTSDNKITIKKYTYDPNDTPLSLNKRKYLINL